jgi:hypothetical protein
VAVRRVVAKPGREESTAAGGFKRGCVDAANEATGAMRGRHRCSADLTGIIVTNPTELPSRVFVFGTDIEGRHDSESGRMAVRLHGAAAGTRNGPTGNAYAIPSLASNGAPLPLSVIGNYVTPFIEYATAHPRTIFQIARFGAGGAEHADEDMARLFANAPANCRLPGRWLTARDQVQAARLLVFDPSSQNDLDVWREQFAQYIKLNAPLWNVPEVEVVSVGNARAIVANDKVAKQLELRHRIFGPDPTRFGTNATVAAEYEAVWYSTHVLSVADFAQTAHPEQMRIMRAAARAGLPVDQLDVGAA